MSGVLGGVARVAQIGGAVAAAGNLASVGSALLSGYLSPAILSGLGPWAWTLRPASFRGLAFAVRASRLEGGRATAVHRYPYRDVVWVEDLGQGVQSYTFDAFLVGDDVYAQRDALKAAIDTPGSATLVHPSLGEIEATAVKFAAGETADRGRVVDLELTFVQSPPRPIFPAASVNTPANTFVQTIAADVAAASDFLARVARAVAIGADVVNRAIQIAVRWARLASIAVADARLIAASVNGLPNINGGRYAAGGRAMPQPLGVTAATALSALTMARETAHVDIAVLAGASIAGFPAAAQQISADVRAAASDPADQVRLLAGMAAFSIAAGASSAAIGSAIETAELSTAALCRRASLTALARAVADYRPSSYDDAVATLNAVAIPLDAEILVAADLGDAATYQALRLLRTAVTRDLITRGSELPKLMTVRRAMPLPSLTLAYQIYGDAGRSDELIARADPINPCFMPVQFLALSPT